MNAQLQTITNEVLPLAASPQLSGNSRLGFAPVASTSRWGFSLSISSHTLGLSGSLYDGRVRSRSTGKERDTESGNDYFGARYYGSSMGRFETPDEAFIDQNPTDPQSWNLYAYVRNNPLVNSDPDGNACVVQTRTGEHTETASVASQGDCSGVSLKDGQSATYVNGTVDAKDIHAGADGHSVDIGFTSYDGKSSGVQNAASAPYPDSPNLSPNWGNNAQGYAMLGAASRVVNTAGSIEVAVMAPWAGAAVDCTSGESTGACAANMALAILPGAGELRAGAKALRAAEELTAVEYISKFCKGGINSVFPKQFNGMTVKEIEAAAKTGNRAARTALKLLTDGRFRK